jgi:hypothetical protein
MARRPGRQRKTSVQDSMGRQYLLNNIEVPRDLVLQHKGAHHRRQRFVSKRLSFICKIDMATGGNFNLGGGLHRRLGTQALRATRQAKLVVSFSMVPAIRT